MNNIAFNFSDPTNVPAGFSYDKTKPTYYTEMLSYEIMRFLAAASAAGAYMSVSADSDTTADMTAFDNYLSEFHTWVLDCASKLSAHLTAKSGSRGALALTAAPQLALASGASLAVLPPALLVKLGTSVINDITEAVTTFRADMREADFVRLFDRAFFEQSWFGDAVDSPYLEGIRKQLSIEHGELSGMSLGDLLQLALTGHDESRRTDDFEPPQEGIVDVLLKNKGENLIKLLCQIVLDKGLSLESITFDTETGKA